MSTPEETLREHIAEDKYRKPFEKESRILWSKESDRIDYFTTTNGLMNRLLLHPEFQVSWCEVTYQDDARKTYHVDRTEVSQQSFEGRRVVALEGSLPLGCLSIRANARNSDSHAEIVTQGVLDND